MPAHRDRFPDLDAPLLLTDGGLETTLVFHEGFELPCFASFVLLDTDEGRAALAAYYARYVALAGEHGAGILLDTPTWRASADWGARLGFDEAGLEYANWRAVELVRGVREALPAGHPPVVIGGSVGPRSDGYRPRELMDSAEAERYHARQIGSLARTEADFVSALTLTHVDEAVGIARAARAAEMPVVLSFTVETDGRLPTGLSLGEAIEATDRATDAYAAFYMVNCAHPTHFAGALLAGGPWTERLGGLRANASRLSHAELDESTTLDDGDPEDLAARMADLAARLGALRVFGGCCGTDHRHVGALARALTATAC